MIDAKALPPMFNKMDLLEFMMEPDILCYLALQNMMQFKIGLDILYVKKVASHVFFLINYARIKVDSNDPLPLEKSLILHYLIILIKSVLNKVQNHYYNNIFLETFSNQLTKK